LSPLYKTGSGKAIPKAAYLLLRAYLVTVLSVISNLFSFLFLFKLFSDLLQHFLLNPAHILSCQIEQKNN
jgi:hypothetical protein